MAIPIPKTTPLLSELLQIEPDDQQAIQIGTEFLATKEAQLQARLARLEEELAESEDLPETHILEHHATDALRALIELLQPDNGSQPVQPIQSAPAIYTEPVMPASNRKLITALVLSIVAWLISLAMIAWLLWDRNQVMVDPPVIVTTVVVSPSSLASEQETQVPHLDTGTLEISPTQPVKSQPGPVTAAPLLPTLPQAENPASTTAPASELCILDDSGSDVAQVPLAVVTETIGFEDGKPLLQVQMPRDKAALHYASAPFGQVGPTVVFLPMRVASTRTLQPGNRLTGCNADGKCYDYQVSVAELWDNARLAQTLAEWPEDLGLLICTDLNNGTAWIIQAQMEEQ